MLNTAKVLISKTLGKFGYVVLKQSSYDRLTHVATDGPSPAPTAVTRGPVEAKKGQPPPTLEHSGLSVEHYNGLLAALQEINNSRILGDIVNCGSGSVALLSAAGTMLSAWRDTDRRLIGLDISGDPTLRTESELTLWGGGTNFLTGPDGYRRRGKRNLGPSVPQSLIDSGYPVERIVLVRDPLLRRVRSGTPDKIAFLAITSDTYPANREAIKLLFERITPGGMIAVEDIRPGQKHRDAVDEFLDERGVGLSFRDISSTLRIALKPREG